MAAVNDVAANPAHIKKNKDKRLAVSIFSFPPDKGNVGTAAYLDVFGSIFAVGKELPHGGIEKPCIWV